MKQCYRCKEIKPAKMFHRDARPGRTGDAVYVLSALANMFMLIGF